MKLLEYEIVDSGNKYEIGRINYVVLLETKKDNEENQNYIDGGCGNASLIEQRWNDYLYEQVGLVDEDVFYFMQSGEEEDELDIDGIKMKMVNRNKGE